MLPKLRPILEDSATRRDQIRQKAVEGLRQAFPMKAGKFSLELGDVKLEPKEYSSNDQKRAILEGRSLAERIRGDVTVKDAAGTVVDTAKNFTLMQLPYFTPRHTFIVDGTEYSVANQLRQKPGVYVRRKGNEELEGAFNLSKGANFKMLMDPEKGLIYMQPTHTTSKIPLHPVLRALGIPHQDIANAWGPEVANMNRDAWRHPDKHLDKLYEVIVHPAKRTATTADEKARQLREYLDGTTMDPEVNAKTLGHPYDRASPAAMLAASKKLLDVYRSASDVDDRDSLEYKTFHSVDDFVKERIGLDAKSMRTKLGWKLDANRGDLKKAMPSGPFTKSMRTLLTGTSLSSTPSQINPLELIDQASKVTMLGEGAIPSERAIPMDARDVHPTHMGILDVARTPECYDAQTEVFTIDGWKTWADVTMNDRLACRVDGRLEFHHPINLVAKPYEGLMYGLRTRDVDYLVTPNHRVWCKPPDAHGDRGWRINTAEEVHGKSRRFDTGHGPWSGDPSSLHTIQLPKESGSNSVVNVGPVDMHDWASFMGWYLSEGCYAWNVEHQTYQTLITQDEKENPSNCARISSLLDRLPWKWCFRTGDTFCISSKQLASYVRQFGHAGDKWIPEYFFTADETTRRNLLDTLLLGDGRTCERPVRDMRVSRNVMTTGSARLASDFQRLAATLGYATSLHSYRDRRDDKYLLMREVRIMTSRFPTSRSKKRNYGYYTQQYNGTVYCAEVPGGLLYVRRNRSLSFWSGNSFSVGVDLRAAIGARRDDNGDMYAPVVDVKTGKPTYLKATDMIRSVVAFPGEVLGPGKLVDAMNKGKVEKVNSDKVTHQIEHVADLYGPTSNLLPLIYGIQGNRVLMASKHQSQAMPLVHREPPLVQTASWNPGKSVEQDLVGLIVPTARHDGVVSKIDSDYIHIRSNDGVKTSSEITKLHYDTNFPLAAKTALNNTLIVKEGDKVKEGQPLAESNFTKDGQLALGTNLRVAYMPYRGLNSNDAIVISQSAANKLTSEHVYQHALPTDGDAQLSREKHRAYYGGNYTKKQYDNLDEKGVVKTGTVLNYGDPIFVGVRPAKHTGDAALLGKLSKSLVKPFEEVVETWNHDGPGEVLDVANVSGRVAASIKTNEIMRLGDKLTGRFGNKGIVGAIIPDNQIIHDEHGRPVDVILTSAGIVSRINPAQITETLLGKAAEKAGKPYVVPQYEPGRDNVEYARQELKKHGLSDKETVYDPATGRKIPGVTVGKSYFVKLMKTTDTNWSARGAGAGYDYNEQPAKGGDEGAKGIGRMEHDGLVSHNARNILYEASAIKGQKNDEFWRAVQLGLPTPAPKTPFVFTKLVSMLQGAGVKVDKSGSQFALGPLTDNDISQMSSGALTDPYKLIRAKDLRPEKGGLFDPTITGGMSGTKWAHVDLAEPIVNPVFEEPVRRLLGLTQKQFDEKVGVGGGWFRRELAKIDVDDKLSELRESTKKAKGPALDGIIKQVKYLEALKSNGLTPDRAYVLSKVPVTPPVIRPILPLQDGKLQVGDANILYKDAFLANDQLHGAKEALPSAEWAVPRKHLYDAVSAVFGVGDPVSPGAAARGTKGYIAAITGTRPGSGFFNSRIMKRQQDVSGRATIAPDPTLNLDEIGVPSDMLFQMYGDFVIGRLVKRGYPAVEARRLLDERAPAARQELLNEARERPVFINRAPSLNRFNIVAAYPRLINGKTLKINPFAERGLAGDYDGDAVQVHAPVTPGGIEDAKKMTLSNLIFSDRKPGTLNVAPEMEAIMGLHKMTKAPNEDKPRRFASQEEAMAAYHRGEIDLNSPIEIKK